MGPVETRFVVLPTRSYTSLAVVRVGADERLVVSNTAREPSLEASKKSASKAPLPPAGPVEISVVVEPARS